MRTKLTISCFLSAILLLQLPARAQKVTRTALLEKVNRKGDELVIPYEKYKLPNGLTVIVHEDHSDPIVHVDVTYHVGSAREQVGKSGFAHFFEHMMFQGSDHVADDEHFKLVSEAGGDLNGTTNSDRTNYYETIPSNQLETALWLEADRMGFLLDAVTQKKFENQRATVKNERGQSVDNRPYGLVYEKVSEALYPYGHPYSWTTIGYMKDLDAGTLEDLKHFFLRWYGPNNATLTVGGDVKPAEVLKLAEKYFGPIKPGPAVEKMHLPAPVLNKDRYISYEDNIRFPMLQMVFPTVPNYHPDEVPLDLLAEILGKDKTSILYKNLVKPQKAVQASAGHPCTELAGQFTFTVLPYPTQTLADMEKEIRNALAEFEKTGITDDALTRFKVFYETNLINSLSSVAGKTSILANYQTLNGNANYLPQDLKRYKAVTKADVMRVYNKYIKGKAAVILSVVPKGKPEGIAHPDNYKVDKSGYTPPKDQYAGLTYVKAQDNFDRSKRPAPGPNPVIKVPAFWKAEAGNGIQVIGTKSEEIPVVNLLFTIKGGHKMEAENAGKAGVASLTADMLNEASEKYSAEEISSQLNKLGSAISFSAGTNQTNIWVESLTKNLDATLALLEERLLHPKFDQADFDRLKKQKLEYIANQKTQASVVASNVYNRLLYGDGNIKAIPTLGNTASVSSLTLDDVKAFYKTNLSPTLTNLVIVGDVERQEIMPKLAFLKQWAATKAQVPQETKVNTIDKTRIYLVDKEKAPQSEIRIGYIALPFDATGDYYKAGIMNHTLGGAFSSRINLNLREDKGYTYGAGSYFSGNLEAGPFTAYAGVRANVTDSAVVEFIKEIKQYAASGITDAELQFTKNAMGQSDALKYETAYQKASFLDDIITYNLASDFVDKQTQILKSISKAELDGLGKKYLPLDRMVIVVVGDKALIKPGLEKLGYEIVETDTDGKPLTML